jgi:hypothetical protein
MKKYLIIILIVLGFASVVFFFPKYYSGFNSTLPPRCFGFSLDPLPDMTDNPLLCYGIPYCPGVWCRERAKPVSADVNNPFSLSETNLKIKAGDYGSLYVSVFNSNFSENKSIQFYIQCVDENNFTEPKISVIYPRLTYIASGEEGLYVLGIKSSRADSGKARKGTYTCTLTASTYEDLESALKDLVALSKQILIKII